MLRLVRPFVHYLLLFLFLLAFAVIEFLIGGTRLLFSLPTYGLLALLAFFTLADIRRENSSAPDLFCLVSSALFFGYVVIRAIASPIEYLARADLFMVLGALIVYFLFAFHLTEPRHRLWVVAALLLIGVGHTALGTVQYLTPSRDPLVPFLEPGKYGLRATGFYICPNHLAGFLEVAALLGLALACWQRAKVWVKIVAAYAALMCLVGLILTGSRGGLLSALVGLLAFVVLSLKVVRGDTSSGRKWVVIPIFVMLVAGIVFAGMRLGRETHIRLRWDMVAPSADTRLAIWQTAIEQFKSAPVLGTGSGTFLYEERRYRKPEQFSDSIYVHNDYLHLLGEYGALGFVGLVLFLSAHLRNGMRALRALIRDRLAQTARLQSNRLALTIGALCAVPTYMVHSLFDFNLHVPANALLFAAIFGFLANPGLATAHRSEFHRRFELALRFAAPALGLWLVVKGLPTLPGEFYSEKARQALVHGLQTPNPVTPRQAIEFAGKALGYDDGNPYSHLYLGQAQLELGELTSALEERKMLAEGAVHAFEKGLLVFPQDRELLLGAGAALDGLNRYDEAEPLYRRALEWNPNSPRVRALYAAHLLAAQKLDQAETEYRASIALYQTTSALEGLEKLQAIRKDAPSLPAQRDNPPP